MPDLILPADYVDSATAPVIRRDTFSVPWHTGTASTALTGTGNFIIIDGSQTLSTTSVWYSSTSATTFGTVLTGTSSTVIISSSRTMNLSYYVSTGENWKPKPRVVHKSVKSSIKRALKLIANFGMEEDVRIFLGGQSIEVSHPDSMFKFVLTKDREIIRATEYPGLSTPYRLSLYTKSDVHVADLCVILKDTPILDQVLALAMFVKTGNEVQLLEKANFRALNSDIDFRRSLAFDSPLLEDKLRVNSVNRLH